MADTDAILDAADHLGKLLADHPATRKLDEVLKRLEAEPDARQLVTDLNRHGEAMAEKEASGSPIEVEDKRKLRELQQAVSMSPLLRDLQMAQMDYVDLMRKVDERIGAGRG